MKSIWKLLTQMPDNMTILNLTIWQNLAKKTSGYLKIWHHLFQAGDKDSFKLQLNHVLCCRPWGVLPDMLDLFEQKNHGRRLQYAKNMYNMGDFIQLYTIWEDIIQIYKYNMIRYEIIDRQRPGPLYKKNTNYKLVSCKDLGHCMMKSQITNCCQARTSATVWKSWWESTPLRRSSRFVCIMPTFYICVSILSLFRFIYGWIY